MKNNEKGEDKAKDRLLSYEIQNKMLQHNEQYIIVDKDIYHYNIAYEFLTLRISFKTEQIFSYFTQDIIDLIWGKYAERLRGSVRLNLSASLSARIYSIFLSQQNSFSRL